MRLKKGDKIIFKDRVETVTKANNDLVNSIIKTELREYSTDFINRWISFGFIKIEK
jgi:hypothetical protein